MANTTTTPSAATLVPTRLSSSMSLPPHTIQRTQSNRIQDLVKYTHIPASAQINETTLSLLNPYNIFKRNKSLATRLTRLVHTRPFPIKEYVQSTGLDKCLIPSSPSEQYVTLSIDQNMIDQWIKDGYSHLHIGSVRIILSLHGRKGLPITARLALLNTIYTQYEHAVIGTCLSTIYAGSISLTYYPNFNIPLRDQNLHKCLKIQVQILGAPMQVNSYMATVHHQLAYRLQGHALDLPLLGHNGDTIFIKAEREDEVPTIFQIPKQLLREKLTEIMPLEWLTNYEKPSQAEQVLNWQSHNARAQNRVLNSIDQKIDRVTRHVSKHDHHLQSLDATFRDLASDLQSRIAKLHSDLHRYISHGYSGPDFDTKEREINHFKSTGELFRRYPILSSPPTKPKKRSPSKQKDKQAASSSYDPVLFAFKAFSSSSKSDSASFSEDVSSQSSQTSCHSSWLDTAVSSPHDHADLTQVLMASRTDPQPSSRTYESPDETASTTPAPFVEEPPEHVPGRPPTKPTNGPWFTLDDTSPGSWRKRVSEMSAWLHLQLAKSEHNLEIILREFVSRFTGSFKDWYQALGEYRQLQFVRVLLASQAMGYIFREFLGDPDHIYKQARQEFFDMRCCSLKRKDIMFHYKQMSQRYHTLGGINDHSLKQVYVNSLPDDLQDEIQRKIDISGRSLNDTSLGELHMYALNSLDKLCATQRFFFKMLTEGKNLQSQCRQPSLQFKCKSLASCNCRMKKKNHFKHFKNKKDIESIFFEQDHTDPSTTFVLQEDLSDSEYSGSSDYSSILESYQATPLVSHFGSQAPVRIRLDKYSNPVDVIAYFDTVVGTPLPDKDILLGWDIFYQSKSLRILPTGIRYKKHFKVFSDIPKIFPLSAIQAPFEHIQQKLLLLCADNHATFSHSSPLWKNPDFFMLPFKLNEDNNPTKATYSGMSPSDFKLANEECNELLRQDERYKTTFCFPNAQYQWTILHFGLKTTPSLFQKAVTRIFHPLLHSALIYIDDILLFSPDETSHNLLLQQFHDIVHHYGIMLSEKKSIVGRSKIKFPGIHISNGQYRPGPHLAVRLLDFPDSDLSVKQVQQFLGIVNYVRDFIPHVSHYTSVLSTLLKKSPPPWSSSHTEAIIKLKEISQSPPTLTIPSSGQLVLQTNASDIFWGAVLIEDREGQRRYCGHASGKFKDAQQHYHTIYKEILAVKYGIQKLDFHLRTRNFIVEMDNSSFPKILDFYNKIPLNPLLLRLKDWFARYDFTVRHVKGHHNIIADMLSRPPLTHLITPTGHYPLIFMTSPTGPPSAGPSSSSPAISDYSFPPELLATLPHDHQISLDQIQSFAKAQLPVYLAHINSQDCRHTVNNLSRPFLDPFIMPPFYYFSPQLLWFLWCLSVLHHDAIVFPLQALYGHLHDPSQ
ncbi:hypothetical protein LWI29_007951 [Acer saccharum]|uniref:Polyprotein n=1 Tax=Acer saccharum TaxID=4024 RepID=A0AA39VBW7_ACESA|nr:hypothetical protein LWI29_007951 [Acer saccharum]